MLSKLVRVHVYCLRERIKSIGTLYVTIMRDYRFSLFSIMSTHFWKKILVDNKGYQILSNDSFDITSPTHLLDFCNFFQFIKIWMFLFFMTGSKMHNGEWVRPWCVCWVSNSIAFCAYKFIAGVCMRERGS